MVVAVLVVATAWISIWMRFRDVGPQVPPQPRDLIAWSFLGCLDIDIDELEAEASAREQELPDLLMLVPDDFDEWGRTYDTYRAWPLASGDAPSPNGSYRWFTRADTLWVVWSEPGTRGGVALRRDRNQLTGRAVLRSDSISLGARATAWPINCHTRRRDWGRTLRR